MENYIKELKPKRIGFIILSVFLFFYYQDFIQELILKYLVIKNDFSNPKIDAFILLSILIAFFYLLKKLLIDKYLFSYNQKFILFISYLILLYYLLSNNLQWKYIEFHLFNSHIQYIRFILFLWTFYILIYLTREIINKIINIKIKENKDKNVYYGDIPLGIIKNDELNYKEITDRLISITKTESHRKSFTVGLIGPWGNGKSTVFNFVKEQIKEDKIILIDFLPFLNHNESDIINEFFTSLSNKLSKYSGILENDIIEYSKKVTSLINDKSINSFFDKKTIFNNSMTANDLYEKINKNLIKINKKVVVFIDDLDRLNEKEILQVLKLIRNTANFRNTIFIVAMDKDYVIERLKKNNEILNSRFIDKFFQLEVYLPEIDKSNLMRIFKNLLIDSKIVPNELELINAINHKDNLFADYIKNIRDVKRVVNQIIFEYPFIKDEIDLKDFINFIYFKLTFPKVVDILNENKNEFLEINSDNVYVLKKAEINDSEVGNEINLFNPNLLDILKKYDIYKIYDEEAFDFLNIENSKKLLFIKSLVYLFGSQNQTETYKSIKFENNFRKLMQQRLSKFDLKESEFKALFNETYDNLPVIIRSFSENKILQLLNRFEYFNTKNIDKIKKVIEILCVIYSEYNNVYEIESLNLLGVFTHRVFNNKKKPNFTKWLKDNIFDNDKLSPKSRLLLFGHLNIDDFNSRFWYLTTKYREKRTADLFKEFLYKFDNNIWEIGDFSFYRVYHSIKKIKNVKGEINKFIIDFWNKNNIEVLCVQLTDLEYLSLNQFKLAPTIKEIFGSNEEFYYFVKNHKTSNTKSIREYLDFLNLFIISEFSIDITYYFKDFKLMVKKLDFFKKKYNYKNTDYRYQLFYESDSSSLYLDFKNISNISGSNFRKSNIKAFQGKFNNLYYFHVWVKKEEIEEGLKEYAIIFENIFIKKGRTILKGTNDKEFMDNVINKEKFIITDYESYVKLYSIKPDYLKY